MTWAVSDPGKPFAPRAPHFSPAAKNVLVIFCSGACSQIDTFDYKPRLEEEDGQMVEFDDARLSGTVTVTVNSPA